MNESRLYAVIGLYCIGALICQLYPPAGITVFAIGVATPCAWAIYRAFRQEHSGK